MEMDIFEDQNWAKFGYFVAKLWYYIGYQNCNIEMYLDRRVHSVYLRNIDNFRMKVLKSSKCDNFDLNVLNLIISPKRLRKRVLRFWCNIQKFGQNFCFLKKLYKLKIYHELVTLRQFIKASNINHSACVWFERFRKCINKSFTIKIYHYLSVK